MGYKVNRVGTPMLWTNGYDQLTGKTEADLTSVAFGDPLQVNVVNATPLEDFGVYPFRLAGGSGVAAGKRAIGACMMIRAGKGNVQLFEVTVAYGACIHPGLVVQPFFAHLPNAPGAAFDAITTVSPPLPLGPTTRNAQAAAEWAYNEVRQTIAFQNPQTGAYVAGIILHNSGALAHLGPLQCQVGYRSIDPGQEYQPVDYTR